MAKIAIVGAGQAGLHLGIGLLMSGHEVTLLSNRTGEQIAAGPVISSQSMYGMALGLALLQGLVQMFMRSQTARLLLLTSTFSLYVRC